MKHVLFYVGLKPGNLLLAEMEDGAYCILRDDLPIDNLRWPHDQIAAATAKFMEMKGQLVSPG